MTNIQFEIDRVKAAIAKTKSPYLKRDYEKYLKKLEKQNLMGGAKGQFKNYECLYTNEV